MSKKWADSSSLILLALKQKPYSTLHNYNVLSIKRSDGTTFMPGTWVFPGGTYETSDSSPAWLNFFKHCGVPDSYVSNAGKNITVLPPMFTRADENEIPKIISLKITAIRETFEETGILIARKPSTKYIETEFAEIVAVNEVSKWRDVVRNDSHQFIAMCENLRCLPDIWGLKLWSDWLTPTNFKKRFDTSFFTACLKKQPTAIADNAEIDKVNWQTPGQLLTADLNGKILLPPPQVYELSRIFPFYMLEDFSRLAQDREQFGCHRFESPLLLTKNGTVKPMCGDDLQNETDIEKFEENTLEELRAMSKHLHRIETYGSMHSRIIIENIAPTPGDILPVQLKVEKNES